LHKNDRECINPLSDLDRGTIKSSPERELLECYRDSRTWTDSAEWNTRDRKRK